MVHLYEKKAIRRKQALFLFSLKVFYEELTKYLNLETTESQITSSL